MAETFKTKNNFDELAGLLNSGAPAQKVAAYMHGMLNEGGGQYTLNDFVWNLQRNQSGFKDALATYLGDRNSFYERVSAIYQYLSFKPPAQEHSPYPNVQAPDYKFTEIVSSIYRSMVKNPDFVSLAGLMNSNLPAQLVAGEMARMLRSGGGEYTYQDFVYNYQNDLFGFKKAVDSYFGDYPASYDKVKAVQAALGLASKAGGAYGLVVQEADFFRMLGAAYKKGLEASDIAPNLEQMHPLDVAPFNAGARAVLAGMLNSGADADEVAQYIDDFAFDGVIQAYNADEKFKKAWDDYFSGRIIDDRTKKAIQKLWGSIEQEAKKAGYSLKPLEVYNNFTEAKFMLAFEAEVKAVMDKGGRKDLIATAQSLESAMQNAKKQGDKLKGERVQELRSALEWGVDTFAFLKDMGQLFGKEFWKQLIGQIYTFMLGEPTQELSWTASFRLLKRWFVDLPLWVVTDVILPVGSGKTMFHSISKAIEDPSPQNIQQAARAYQMFLIDLALFMLPAEKIFEAIAKAKKMNPGELTRLFLEKAKAGAGLTGEALKRVWETVIVTPFYKWPSRWIERYRVVARELAEDLTRQFAAKYPKCPESILKMFVRREIVREMKVRAVAEKLAGDFGISYADAKKIVGLAMGTGKPGRVPSLGAFRDFARPFTLDELGQIVDDLERLPKEVREKLVDAKMRLLAEEDKSIFKKAMEAIMSGRQKARAVDEKLLTSRIEGLEAQVRPFQEEFTRLRQELARLFETHGVKTEGDIAAKDAAFFADKENRKMLVSQARELVAKGERDAKDLIDDLVRNAKEVNTINGKIVAMRETAWYSMYGRFREAILEIKQGAADASKRIKERKLAPNSPVAKAWRERGKLVEDWENAESGIEKLKSSAREKYAAGEKLAADADMIEIDRLKLKARKLKMEIFKANGKAALATAWGAARWPVVAPTALFESIAKLPLLGGAFERWFGGMAFDESFGEFFPNYVRYYFQRIAVELGEETAMSQRALDLHQKAIPVKIIQGNISPEADVKDVERGKGELSGVVVPAKTEVIVRQEEQQFKLNQKQAEWIENNTLPGSLPAMEKALKEKQVTFEKLQAGQAPDSLKKMFDWKQHPLVQADQSVIEMVKQLIKPGMEMQFFNELGKINVGSRKATWNDFIDTEAIQGSFKKYIQQ